MFYGDTNGWLYSFDDNHGRYGYQPAAETEYGITGSWVSEINLTSKARPAYIVLIGVLASLNTTQISSICVSDSIFVATSFGPASKVMVQNLSSAESATCILLIQHLNILPQHVYFEPRKLVFTRYMD